MKPLPPAPVAGRTDTCQRIADVVFGALSQAVPKQVIAGCNSAVTSIMFGGENARSNEYFVYLETIGGGSGARPHSDGMDGVKMHITNTSNLPVESLESEYPLFVDRYELITDSGGAGQYRGGLGIERGCRGQTRRPGGVQLCRRSPKFPPWGLFGGSIRPGRPICAEPGNGKRSHPAVQGE